MGVGLEMSTATGRVMMTRRPTLARVLLLLALFGIGVPSSLFGQSEPQGSRYLSLDHPAYEAIRQLRDRGYLPKLDPLVQPYRRLDIARGLESIDEDDIPRHLAHIVGLLRNELSVELQGLAGEGVERLGIQLSAGGVASSSRRLDPLLPLRGEDSFYGWPKYSVGGWGEAGRFAVDVRLQHDLWFESGADGDPDGKDPGGIIVFHRTDNAYLTAQYALGTLFVGRMRRNWAPLGTTGLMVSPTPSTYPQLGLDLRIGPLKVDFMVGELDALPGWEDRYWKRWIVANRLSYSRENLVLSVGEARVVSSPRAGPGLGNLNPVDLYFFDQEPLDEHGQPFDFSQNGVLNGQFWVRQGSAVFYGEALLDDIDVTPAEGQDPEPMSYALSVGARFYSLVPGGELELQYRRVSAFAYRTLPMDGWTYFDRGLGDPFSDYDRITLRASFFPRVPGLRLTPGIQFQRKGEGDFRLPLPDSDEEYRANPSIFLGTVEKTSRVMLQGHYQPKTSFFVEWDAGANFVTEADHQPGEKLTEFSGLIRLGFYFDRFFGGS